MDLYVDDLLAIDPDLVDQIAQELAQKLQEAIPTADLGLGVLHDVAMQVMTLINAAAEERVARVLRSQSLLAISRDPTLADDDVVAQVLSNFRISRQPGVAASGLMTVVVDALLPITVPAGAVYTAGTVQFAPATSFAARTSAAQVVAATDRVLRPLGDGTYAFTIPVTATTPGAAGALRRGARLVPAAPPPHFVTAYAEGDFAGGYDAESNADLLARLQAGVAAKAWSNRPTIDAMLRDQPAFARILQISIVGFGDPEMTRDRRSIFPVSLGGRCDLYARTAQLPLATTLQVDCTFVRASPQGGIWQFSLGRDAAPGFYAVDRVAPPGAAPGDSGFAITSDVRGLDNAPVAGWAPDVLTAAEAAYSPLQTGTFQFLDTATPVAGLVANVSRATYDATVPCMPLLADLQAFVAGRDVRGPAGDVLVRAPIPCFLSVGFAVRKRAGVAAPDVAAIRAAVAAAVNTLGFAGQLHASTVVGAVRDLLPQGAGLSVVDLFGRVRRPDGTWLPLRSPAVIVIPDEGQSGVSGRTVAFILDPDDVAVTVVDAEPDDA